MEIVVDNDKIECPKCASSNCFEETHTVEANSVKSYICMGCGYTTTTLNKPDSDFIKEFEETAPELFKDIKFFDKERGIVWYPTVLNFPELGLVFPDGTDSFNWQWRAVPVVPVGEDEKQKYPIPGEEGKFYEHKADMESSRLYSQESFIDACKYLKIVVE